MSVQPNPPADPFILKGQSITVSLLAVADVALHCPLLTRPAIVCSLSAPTLCRSVMRLPCPSFRSSSKLCWRAGGSESDSGGDSGREVVAAERWEEERAGAVGIPSVMGSVNQLVGRPAAAPLLPALVHSLLVYSVPSAHLSPLLSSPLLSSPAAYSLRAPVARVCLSGRCTLERDSVLR